MLPLAMRTAKSPTGLSLSCSPALLCHLDRFSVQMFQPHHKMRKARKMGIEYAIASEDKDFRIDTQYFVEKLRNRWPGAEIRFNLNPQIISVFQWSLTMDDNFMLGDFNEQGISFKGGSLSNVASFALWYATLVPSKHKLFLYNSSLDHKPIELVKGITLENILAGFNIPLDLSEYE